MEEWSGGLSFKNPKNKKLNFWLISRGKRKNLEEKNSGVWKKLEIFFQKFETGVGSCECECECWECEFDGTSVSRSEEEMEEIVGEDGGGTNSEAGSSIVVLWLVLWWMED